MKMKVFIILLAAFIVGIGLALLQGYGNFLKTQVSQPETPVGRVAGIYSAACLADCQKDCAEDDLSCRQQCQDRCGE